MSFVLLFFLNLTRASLTGYGLAVEADAEGVRQRLLRLKTDLKTERGKNDAFSMASSNHSKPKAVSINENVFFYINQD